MGSVRVFKFFLLAVMVAYTMAAVLPAKKPTTTKAPPTTKTTTTRKPPTTTSPPTTKTTTTRKPPTTKTTTTRKTPTTKTTTTRKPPTTTTKKPPTTTSPPTTNATTTTTKPVTCEGLVNPANGDPCMQCWCYEGEYQCATASCLAPMCVDSVSMPGVCCPVCPNGNNCIINGVTVAANETFMIEGVAECHCVFDASYGMRADCISVTTTPITTPEICDENQDNSDPCFKCMCMNNEKMCYYIDCAPAQCVDGYTKPGDCCTTCPNGRNCAVEGRIIPYGSQVYVEGVGECYCFMNEQENRLLAVCVPPTPPTTPLTTPPMPPSTPPLTPSTPANCEHLTNPGAGDPCQYCFCSEGRYVCYIAGCPSRCVDNYKRPGACCPDCPNDWTPPQPPTSIRPSYPPQPPTSTLVPDVPWYYTTQAPIEYPDATTTAA